MCGNNAILPSFSDLKLNSFANVSVSVLEMRWQHVMTQRLRTLCFCMSVKQQCLQQFSNTDMSILCVLHSRDGVTDNTSGG